MEYTGLNELRKKFLDFFESKKHTILSSAPLVPQGDKSLLLINSGMAPLKKYFLGVETPPNKRVATCQKCIRTPDIERVGKTSRHGTYFEMLGNFSFGDYFKNEAIEWAWEFFTETLALPKDRLYCSVYLEDDEAFDIWTKKIGVAEDHMVRLGKEDNFWEHGSGPCGPCSEIYFDRGEGKGCGSPDCKVGCDCDRFVEVWNLVFSQFDSDGKGTYTEMETKNIDTGMGLERLACVMQEVDNLFEVDTVQNIMQHICKLAGVEYKKSERRDVSLRVITDHIRSTVFMIGDGVLPSNEGRGYVLRRLLRRAARHGILIELDKPFLYEVAETVIKENESAYPELREKADYIKKIIQVEEENFAKTVQRGFELLNEHLNEKGISGEVAFRLSDTFGFPIDLTLEIAGEKGITVDIDTFNELVKKQRETARADYHSKASSSWESGEIKLDLPPTEFLGYEKLECYAKVLYVDENSIILDETPFYAESGGQVGDMGVIFYGKNPFRVYSVIDTKKDTDGHFIHHIAAKHTEPEGADIKEIEVGDIVFATVSKARRVDIARNHTSAHILQAGLREVLGDHVHQAGQLVNDKECRFDFNHFSALTAEELKKVEEFVNYIINYGLEVNTRVLPVEEAKKEGAMALFGEKYGDDVRVVSVDVEEWNGFEFEKGSFSKEFCGGTHVKNTAEIGSFKIVSENSVAAGVRRITAVTGSGVLELLNKYQEIVNNSAKTLKIPNAFELESKVAEITVEMREINKEIEKLHSQGASNAVEELFKTATEKDGVLILAQKLEGINVDSLRVFGDKLKDKASNIVAVLAGISEDKGTLLCVCGKDAIAKGYKAGDIVKKVSALTGGKGGGRPDSAMAGIGDISKIDEALKSV
ncbi:MAG: alanine--tRNA ligase [Oscillospiraceae bacterium]|nr:alanine--tRNA ligase [Oscillospiraceae bacterium]